MKTTQHSAPAAAHTPTDEELLPFVELFGAGYRSAKFKLFGYATERQLLNAIRRKLKAAQL